MFPSPFRGSYFSISIRSRQKDKKRRTFPSPFRGSYFSITKLATQAAGRQNGFRPLSGDLISQSTDVLSSLSMLLSFPSPFRGSYFSIKEDFEMSEREKRFRPLPGDLISQCFRNNCIWWLQGTVSVPFPGILFLNCFLTELKVIYDKFPSPSRGSYFSISIYLL